MYFRKKEEPKIETTAQEKPRPAFLREDYPYKAVGDAITDLESLEPSTIYEIKCHACEMAIRSQGQNIRDTYERLKESGCLGCGNKELVIRKVDMSKAPASPA